MIKNFNSSCSRIANLTVSGAVSTSKQLYKQFKLINLNYGYGYFSITYA